jgi:hypothetical protein
MNRLVFLIVAAALASSAAHSQDGLHHAIAGLINADPMAALGQAIARGEYPKTTSVLIVRNGEVAFENYFGDGSKERLTIRDRPRNS